MATITATDVNKLRQMTGSGMMDCKNALVEAEGDFQNAIDILRKKGQKVANKRSDRSASDGIVLAKASADNKSVVIIMLNCETDFVARNQGFIDSANAIIEKALAEKPASLENLLSLSIDNLTINDMVIDLTGKIGEKIELSSYALLSGEKVAAYNHPGNRLASIIAFTKECDDDTAKDVAMQIAAMNPVSLDKSSVPQDVIDRELTIGKEMAIQEGKPEAMIEKIALGKLEKFFKENTLVSQPFIKDQKVSVGQYIDQKVKDIKIIDFKRFALSE